jgi:integrase
MIANEIRALLAACHQSTRDYAIFRVAYHHGLRASEVGMLSMSDWFPDARMENDRLMIHRLKKSISAETRIVPAAAEALRRWVKKRGSQPGPIFPSRNDKPISRQRLDELVKMYGKKAGIPEDKRHFHSLRHTCATSLLSEHNLDVAHVKDHLGHKNIQNTMIYAQLTAAASDARFNKLRTWR